MKTNKKLATSTIYKNIVKQFVTVVLLIKIKIPLEILPFEKFDY